MQDTFQIPAVQLDAGSFRDPASRVFHGTGGCIFRGLDETAAANFRRLEREPFYREFVEAGMVIPSRELPTGTAEADAIARQGWPAALAHQAVPFVSYPFEWCPSMLREGALLTLDLLAGAARNGWMLKDASAFNILWQGTQPIFVDVPSFQPRNVDEPWLAYSQFSRHFLIPLLLRSHLGIDFNGLLRADMEGIGPDLALKIFGWPRVLCRGVLAHVVLPVVVDRFLGRNGGPSSPAMPRQSTETTLGLAESLRRLVARLAPETGESSWSGYASTPPYNADEIKRKVAFVRECLGTRRWEQAWDLGCNTGQFSRLCAEHAQHVIAVDNDAACIERLFADLRKEKISNILPLVTNLANPAPDQGWAAKERRSFAGRGQPDIVVCLALIHHLTLSCNIPIPMILDWLRGLNASVIVEFADRHDEMVAAMLARKRESHAAYSRAAFETEAGHRYRVLRSLENKSGKRILYFLQPL